VPGLEGKFFSQEKFLEREAAAGELAAAKVLEGRGIPN
jgi:hypothetical protein